MSNLEEVRKDLLDRVNRGIALLDQKLPAWEDQIVTANLNIVDPDNCIIGQLAQRLNIRYRHLLRLIGLSGWEESRLFGFDAPGNYEPGTPFADLTVIWKARIQEIRATRSVESVH